MASATGCSGKAGKYFGKLKRRCCQPAIRPWQVSDQYHAMAYSVPPAGCCDSSTVIINAPAADEAPSGESPAETGEPAAAGESTMIRSPAEQLLFTRSTPKKKPAMTSPGQPGTAAGPQPSQPAPANRGLRVEDLFANSKLVSSPAPVVEWDVTEPARTANSPGILDRGGDFQISRPAATERKPAGAATPNNPFRLNSPAARPAASGDQPDFSKQLPFSGESNRATNDTPSRAGPDPLADADRQPAATMLKLRAHQPLARPGQRSSGVPASNAGFKQASPAWILSDQKEQGSLFVPPSAIHSLPATGPRPEERAEPVWPGVPGPNSQSLEPRSAKPDSDEVVR